jgi:hypothetical protein
MSVKRPAKDDLAIAAFRIPKSLRSRAKAKAWADELTFSELIRRAIGREVAREPIALPNANKFTQLQRRLLEEPADLARNRPKAVHSLSNKP